MKNYIIYENNGKMNQLLSTELNGVIDIENIKEITDDQYALHFDLLRYYKVENGEIVKIQPECPDPKEYHQYDYENNVWVPDLPSASFDVRQKRDELLANSDWTDTLSAKSRLGDDLYNQWQEYRQALRDITLQPGFPLSVTYPVSP